MTHTVRVTLAMSVKCREMLNSTAMILERSPSWVMRQLITYYAASLTHNYRAALQSENDESA